MAGPGSQDAVEVPTVVAVPERGYADVSKFIWNRLEASEDFPRLIERGILSATLLPGGGVRLNGACFVGRAQCGDVILELREKVDGALMSLLGHATQNAFRIEQAASPASELGSLASLLVRQFVTAVKSYASHGRGFEYTVERQTGSLVGGRLDITRSVQLRARGLGHLLVFDKNTVTYSTPVNRVVLAALREVEHLSRLVRLREEDVASARGLAILFADCRDAEVIFGSRSRFVCAAQTLLNSGLPAAIRDMVALASVVLAHESFEHSSISATSAPRSWFLNLESLFETACRSVLADVLRSLYAVSRGGEHAKRVFPGLAGEFSANPDLVLTIGTQTSAVGDVKYKVWNGSAAASDIYQLLAHAAAFNCDQAFLLYPSDHFTARRLGRAETGTDVHLFAVDVRRMRDGIRRIAAELGLEDGA